MDRAADLVAEDVVDQLVLLDAREPFKALRDHLGSEMVTAAGGVDHGHLGPREGLLDARS